MKEKRFIEVDKIIFYKKPLGVGFDYNTSKDIERSKKLTKRYRKIANKIENEIINEFNTFLINSCLLSAREGTVLCIDEGEIIDIMNERLAYLVSKNKK